MLRLGDEAFESGSLEGWSAAANISGSFSGLTDPRRGDQKQVAGGVSAIMFDFDGTLTATPGDRSARRYKIAELKERSSMLRPWLERLGGAGIVLGIISKSTEDTIFTALGVAGLRELFQGPIVGKAVGFEGKAGFIEELVRSGGLRHLGPHGLRRVLLVDDDVRELERARARGVQVFAAPEDGGLREPHFEELFLGLGLRGRLASPALGPARFGELFLEEVRGEAPEEPRFQEFFLEPAPTPVFAACSARASCETAMPTATSATSTTVSWASMMPSPSSSPRSAPRTSSGSLLALELVSRPRGAADALAPGSPLGVQDVGDDEGPLWMSPARPGSCAAALRGAKRLFGRTSPRGAALGPGYP